MVMVWRPELARSQVQDCGEDPEQDDGASSKH